MISRYCFVCWFCTIVTAASVMFTTSLRTSLACLVWGVKVSHKAIFEILSPLVSAVGLVALVAYSFRTTLSCLRGYLRPMMESSIRISLSFRSISRAAVFVGATLVGKGAFGRITNLRVSRGEWSHPSCWSHFALGCSSTLCSLRSSVSLHDGPRSKISRYRGNLSWGS